MFFASWRCIIEADKENTCILNTLHQTLLKLTYHLKSLVFNCFASKKAKKQSILDPNQNSKFR